MCIAIGFSPTCNFCLKNTERNERRIFLLPVRQMVTLKDECQRGAEFGVHSHGAPQLGLGQTTPGLHLRQQFHTWRYITGDHHCRCSGVLLTCKAGLGCPCRVCLTVTRASMDPSCAAQPPTSPIAWTLQSEQWTSAERLRRGPVHVRENEFCIEKSLRVGIE